MSNADVAATDLTAQIAEAQRTLAEATKGCLRYKHGERAAQGESKEKIGPCAKCKGTGHVARFPGFRQDCPHCEGDIGHALVEDVSATPSVVRRSSSCFCNGLGWQVRAGGLEAGLAGLEPEEAAQVLFSLSHWIRCTKINRHFEADGVECHLRTVRPPESEIRVKGLELVIEVAGL